MLSPNILGTFYVQNPHRHWLHIGFEELLFLLIALLDYITENVLIYPN
jgi:hypothetical protein